MKPVWHGLNTLRAVAIILVFFFHYQIPVFGHPEWLSDWINFGWTGVDLFFVLSGFLISSNLFEQIRERNSIDIKQYFLRRISRIFPAYLVILLIYFCVPFFREKEHLPPLWKFLSFTQNINLDFIHQGTFSHAWSLCVEEYFYFLFPFITLGMLRIRKPKVLALFILGFFLLGLFLRHLSWEECYSPQQDSEYAGMIWYKYIYYPTYNRLDGLLVGISIALIYGFKKKLWERLVNNWALLFCLGLLILYFASIICEGYSRSYSASVFAFPLISLGYGLIVISALSRKCFLFSWNSKVFTVIAGISYSLYLCHKGVIHVTQRLFSPWFEVNGTPMLICCVLTSLISAGILYLLVERPLMLGIRKMVQRNYI